MFLVTAARLTNRIAVWLWAGGDVRSGIFVRKPEGRENVQYAGVDERIILKRIFKE